MPTYDYICTACKHEFEEFQQMSAKPLKKCPECGKPKLERKIGIGAGVLFKGGGFYETDYRSESYKKAVEAESKPAESKADAKPAPEPKSEADTGSGRKAAETKPALSPKAGSPGKKKPRG